MNGWRHDAAVLLYYNTGYLRHRRNAMISLYYHRRRAPEVVCPSEVWWDVKGVAGGEGRRSEVEGVVAGLPVARVSAVGPADYRIETGFGAGGVLNQPHGTIGFQDAVRSLDYVAFARFPLAFHIVRFRVMDRVVKLVRFGRLSYKIQTHHVCRIRWSIV